MDGHTHTQTDVIELYIRRKQKGGETGANLAFFKGGGGRGGRGAAMGSWGAL